MSEDKTLLRQQMRMVRQAIPNTRRQQAGRLVCEAFRQYVEKCNAQTVFLYLHLPDELPTDQLWTPEFLRSRRVVIPYCVGQQLQLFHWESPDELQIGRFQILEPRPELRTPMTKQVAPAAIDLLLIPGVAFDAQCHRLGWGGGFFDRFLPTLRVDAMTIGAAFDEQIVEQVPCEPHDRPLTQVWTPTRRYGCDSDGMFDR
ncbi:MAG: 5-formyltetrahydrofolate cyclo-ligase [Thermoguttaceae bacterium]|nr:5-formyltetrahydrofolate cyclo-ligase [Thermoguttaceae bacterium]